MLTFTSIVAIMAADRRHYGEKATVRSVSGAKAVTG